MRVAIQVFSFKEPYDQLTGVMDAYTACSVPGYVSDVAYHACVTPAGTEADVAAAVDHDTFEYVEMPRGKVSSRNAAHDMASAAGFDVILAGDADAPPMRADYLERLLNPIAAGEAVAVNSRPVSPGVLGAVINAAARLEDYVMPHMHGQGSSFTAAAWDHCGPFASEIDETSMHDVRGTEEFGFYDCLSSYGPVAYDREAMSFNDTRRWRCIIRSAGARTTSDPFCQRRGVETFDRRR